MPDGNFSCSGGFYRYKRVLNDDPKNTTHVRIEYTDGEGKKQVFEGDVKNRYKVAAEYLGNDVKIDGYVKDDPPK